MTYKELKQEIFALGFDDQSKYKEDPNIIPTGINRAMAVITTEIAPIVGVINLSHQPQENICTTDGGYYNGSDPLVFTAVGARAFALLCDGVGLLTVTDDNGVREIELTGGGYGIYRDFATGSVSLSFTGDYAYSVKSLGIYSSINSLALEDIHLNSQYISYDFKDYDEDFYNFKELGYRDNSGVYKAINDYYIDSETILNIPRTPQGEYIVKYRKLPKKFTQYTEDTENIQLDSWARVLLPLLASYYIWIDDDATKASIYRNEYEAIRNSIIIRQPKQVATILGGGQLWQ